MSTQKIGQETVFSMTFENNLHYLSFSDRPTVEEMAAEYDSLILPSHLIIGGRGKIPTLVNKLVRDEEISYYIKPAVTEFRAGTNFRKKGELRPWFQKLVSHYGPPLSDILSDDYHMRFDNIPDEKCRKICSQISDFQESFVQETVREAVGKYDDIVDNLYPRAIIPWFELIDNIESIHPNRQLIKFTKEATDFQVKPCIFVKLDFISDVNHRTAITSMLDEMNVSEAFLWIDQLGLV